MKRLTDPTNRPACLICALPLATVIGLVVAGDAHALIIDAVADTWIRESDPTGAYPDDFVSVWDGTSTDQRRHGVLMFDLSSTVGVNINSAFFGLFDQSDDRSQNNPIVQQTFVLDVTPSIFPADFETYNWQDYVDFDQPGESALTSLGAYDIAEGDTIGGYEYSDMATAGDISLLEQTRDAQSGSQEDLVVFVLKATTGERDWGDIELRGTVPRLYINEPIPVLGDFTGDGMVTIDDYNVMIDPANWLQTVLNGTRGDLDANGVVNLDDFSGFKPVFLAANPGVPFAAAVPEPATLASVFAVAGVACIARRRRRRSPLSTDCGATTQNLGMAKSPISRAVSCAAALVLTMLSAAALLPPSVASAVTVTESYDTWIRDEGLTAGDRDGDWLGVYNSAAGGGLSRWSLLEFDFSGIAPLTVNDVQFGFWHMFAGSPIGSSDPDPSMSRVSMLTEVGGATTATADFTWAQLNDPGQVTLAEFETLGAIDLAGLTAAPSEADRYHFGAGSAADRAAIQSLVDSGSTLRIVVRSDESVLTNLRVDWGDGPDDGDDSHGQSAILLINDPPPEVVELALQINTASGGMSIVNPGMDPAENTMFEFDGYLIESPAESLNPGGFTGLTGAGESGWDIVAPSISALTELSLTSSVTLAEGESFSLGTGFTPGAAEDGALTFQYNVAGGQTISGDVVYVTGSGADANGDGKVDGADFLLIQRDDPSILAQWNAEYGTGVAQSAAAQVVPEPSALLLLFGGGLALAGVRRRR